MWIWQCLPLVGIILIFNRAEACKAFVTKDLVIFPREDTKLCIDRDNYVVVYDTLGHPLKCACKHMNPEEAEEHKRKHQGSKGPVLFPGAIGDEEGGKGRYESTSTHSDRHKGTGSHSESYSYSSDTGKPDGYKGSSSQQGGSDDIRGKNEPNRDESHGHQGGSDGYRYTSKTKDGYPDELSDGLKGSYSPHNEYPESGRPKFPGGSTETHSHNGRPNGNSKYSESWDQSGEPNGYSISFSSSGQNRPNGYKTSESHGPQRGPDGSYYSSTHGPSRGPKGSAVYSESYSSTGVPIRSDGDDLHSASWSETGGPKGSSSSISTSGQLGPNGYKNSESHGPQHGSDGSYYSSTHGPSRGPKGSAVYSESHSSSGVPIRSDGDDLHSASWSETGGPKGSSSSFSTSGQLGPNGYKTSESHGPQRGPDGSYYSSTHGPSRGPKGPAVYSESHSSTGAPIRSDGDDLHSASWSETGGPKGSSSSFSTSGQLGPNGYKNSESHGPQQGPDGSYYSSTHGPSRGPKGSTIYSESHSSTDVPIRSVGDDLHSASWSETGGPKGSSSSFSTSSQLGPNGYKTSESHGPQHGPDGSYYSGTHGPSRGPKGSTIYSESHSSTDVPIRFDGDDLHSASWSETGGPKGSSSSFSSSGQIGPNGYKTSESHGPQHGPDGSYYSSSYGPSGGPKGSVDYSMQHSSTDIPGRSGASWNLAGGPSGYSTSFSSTGQLGPDGYKTSESHGPKFGPDGSYYSSSHGPSVGPKGYSESLSATNNYGRPREKDTYSESWSESGGPNGYGKSYNSAHYGSDGSNGLNINRPGKPDSSFSSSSQYWSDGSKSSEKVGYSESYGSTNKDGEPDHKRPGESYAISTQYRTPNEYPQGFSGNQKLTGQPDDGPTNGPYRNGGYSSSSAQFGTDINNGKGGYGYSFGRGGNSKTHHGYPDGRGEYEGSTTIYDNNGPRYGLDGSYSRSWSESQIPDGFAKSSSITGYNGPYNPGYQGPTGSSSSQISDNGYRGPRGPLYPSPYLGGDGNHGGIGGHGGFGDDYHFPVGCFTGHIVATNHGGMKWIVNSLNTPKSNGFQERQEINSERNWNVCSPMLRTTWGNSGGSNTAGATCCNGFNPNSCRTFGPCFNRCSCAGCLAPCYTCDRNCCRC